MEAKLKALMRTLLILLPLAIWLSTPAYAGFWALPLEANLDLADRVVVGQITNIVITNSNHDGMIECGKATIAVKETLKGSNAETVVIVVAVTNKYLPGYGPQSPPRTYAVGDQGIWVYGHGLLSLWEREQVKEHLEMLKNRHWSDTVNGIKVWVGVAKRNVRFNEPYQVMFAVKNVSEQTIYMPRSMYPGFVSIVAHSERGQFVELGDARDQIKPREEMFCHPLEPGCTRYMHWRGENQGAFLMPKDAPPGTYTIRGTLANDRNDGQIGISKDSKVQPWVGKVSYQCEDKIIVEGPKPNPQADINNVSVSNSRK